MSSLQEGKEVEMVLQNPLLKEEKEAEIYPNHNNFKGDITEIELKNLFDKYADQDNSLVSQTQLEDLKDETLKLLGLDTPRYRETQLSKQLKNWKIEGNVTFDGWKKFIEQFLSNHKKAILDEEKEIVKYEKKEQNNFPSCDAPDSK